MFVFLAVESFGSVDSQRYSSSAIGSPSVRIGTGRPSVKKSAGQRHPEWFKRAMHSEKVYQNRLARLRALRDLAEERGQTEKVARIDALFEQLEVKYAEREARLRELAGNHDAERLEGQFAEWREAHR